MLMFIWGMINAGHRLSLGMAAFHIEYLYIFSCSSDTACLVLNLDSPLPRQMLTSQVHSLLKFSQANKEKLNTTPNFSRRYCHGLSN